MIEPDAPIVLPAAQHHKLLSTPIVPPTERLPYKMEDAVADAVDRLSLKVDDEIVMEKCAACQATPQADGKPLQDCGGCRSIKYCSRECQLAHRKEHKVDCNILKYEKMAYKRWCLDQDVDDGLYDLREDT